jgi:hypothetical protein
MKTIWRSKIVHQIGVRVQSYCYLLYEDYLETSDLPLQLMIQDIVHYRVLHEQSSEQIVSLQHE